MLALARAWRFESSSGHHFPFAGVIGARTAIDKLNFPLATGAHYGARTVDACVTRATGCAGGGPRHAPVAYRRYFPFAPFPATLSTASASVCAPRLIVGSGTGAKNGEWLTGSGFPSAL